MSRSITFIVRRFVTAALMVAPLAQSVHAGAECLQWVAADAPGTAGAFKSRAVYDSMRGVTVLLDSSGVCREFVNGIWLNAATPPLGWSIESLPSIAFDNHTGETIVQQGANMYRYDGFQWSSLPDAPVNVNGSAMVYDSARQRIVLFGGKPDAGPAINQTWEYVGQNWALIPTQDSPPARDMHAMAYDAHRGVIVLFGGRDTSGARMGDTWEYDGSNWIDRTSAQFPSPSPRFRHDVAYQSNLRLTVLHGGNSAPATGDTWTWDGERWTVRLPSGQIFSSLNATIVHDIANNITRRIGPGEHRELQSSGMTPEIVQQPQNALVAEGNPAQFSVATQPQQGLMAYQWRHNGQNIPGATSSAYAISAATPSDAGTYDCVVRIASYGDMSCGTEVSIAATLTVLDACPSDVTGDLFVDVDDLVAVILGWGACP